MLNSSQIHKCDWTFLPSGIYTIQAVNKTLVKKCSYHPSAWFRIKGLLGKSHLASDEGILLKPCNSIHTFFMQFPIDVVCINKQGRVTRIFENLKPWKITPPSFKDYATIELPAHTLKKLNNLSVGTLLSIYSIE